MLKVEQISIGMRVSVFQTHPNRDYGIGTVVGREDHSIDGWDWSSKYGGRWYIALDVNPFDFTPCFYGHGLSST